MKHNRIMKHTYRKPAMYVAELQLQQQLLDGSNVIPPGQPNEPAAAPSISNNFNSGYQKSDVIIWDETW